ncbi:unnamed protein product, partial [Didymodactylos carnosus]
MTCLCSVMDYQAVEYKNQVENIRIRYIQNIPYLFLQDVRSYFPVVATLRLNKAQIPFVVDTNSDELLLPLRIRAYPSELLTGCDLIQTISTNIDEIAEEEAEEQQDNADSRIINDKLETYLTQMHAKAKLTISQLTGIEQIKYLTNVGCFVF